MHEHLRPTEESDNSIDRLCLRMAVDLGSLSPITLRLEARHAVDERRFGDAFFLMIEWSERRRRGFEAADLGVLDRDKVRHVADRILTLLCTAPPTRGASAGDRCACCGASFAKTPDAPAPPAATPGARPSVKPMTEREASDRIRRRMERLMSPPPEVVASATTSERTPGPEAGSKTEPSQSKPVAADAAATPVREGDSV